MSSPIIHREPIRGLGEVNGLTDVGLAIMQVGMVTGLHAAISPSFFTFACFARKREECEIAKRTLWVSWAATTLVNLGIFFAFRRWTPLIAGQVVGTGLFVGGMLAVRSDEVAPAQPTMAPRPEAPMAGLGQILPFGQPDTMRVGPEWHHYQDRDPLLLHRRAG